MVRWAILLALSMAQEVYSNIYGRYFGCLLSHSTSDPACVPAPSARQSSRPNARSRIWRSPTAGDVRPIRFAFSRARIATRHAVSRRPRIHFVASNGRIWRGLAVRRPRLGLRSERLGFARTWPGTRREQRSRRTAGGGGLEEKGKRVESKSEKI